MTGRITHVATWGLSALLLAACSTPAPTPAPATDMGSDGGTLATDAAVASDGDEGGASVADAMKTDGATSIIDAAHDMGVVLPEASAPIDPIAEEMHSRADQALATLMLTYGSALRANTSTYDWMYAHYWDAVLDATERRGPNAFSGTARMFFELQAQRGWLDGFYDDENWITLALLHAYKVTGETRYLDQAKVVFDDIMKAWDTTCCGTHLGGLFWQKPKKNKVTAINAGAVVSASRLYEDTQDATYLSFAKKVYEFWSTTMVDASTGHVYDGFDNAGTINTSWSFTYNEGLFIGAIVELSRVTQDTSRLPLAHKVAGYMMTRESAKTSAGTILTDGKCSGDGEMFKAVGARYLGELYAVDTTHTEYRDFLRHSGDAAWTLARDPATGLISCDWAGPFDTATAQVGSLGSAAVGLAAAAKALGEGAKRPALQYEAEEGDLHGVGLEATNAGFSGWGYVAGWGSDGQSIDLLIDAPSAGDYQVDFRYATGGDAKRTIAVTGAGAGASLTFPSTGGYGTYRTVSTTVTLPSGASTLSITLTTAKGGTGYLNLDRVDLTKKAP